MDMDIGLCLGIFYQDEYEVLLFGKLGSIGHGILLFGCIGTHWEILDMEYYYLSLWITLHL